MRNISWMAGRVLVGFLVFDLIGVLLGLFAGMLAGLHRTWESSEGLGYAVWFVTGVLCAAFLYGPELTDEPGDRRRGLQLTGVTAGVALALGLLSSLVWSGSGAVEAVAPDHRGVTITYLATVVSAVALAHFVLFRGTVPGGAGSAPSRTAAAPGRAPAPAVPAAKPGRTAARRRGPGEAAGFAPAGVWASLGFLAGVPVLLFLDASVFVLGPFDVFDRWTGPILATALAGGLAWGFAASRWRGPRLALWALHAPLLLGTVFYFFATFAGGLWVAMGVSGAAAARVAQVAFGVGAALGGAAIVGAWLELFGRKGAARR